MYVCIPSNRFCKRPVEALIFYGIRSRALKNHIHELIYYAHKTSFLQTIYKGRNLPPLVISTRAECETKETSYSFRMSGDISYTETIFYSFIIHTIMVSVVYIKYTMIDCGNISYKKLWKN